MDILSINRERLLANIDALASIGQRQDHGLYRMAFSEGDMQGREWLKQRIDEAGLEFYQDGAGNLHGRLDWDGKRPSVMMGSHIDTVPGAGHLDGALGVLVALECLTCFKEQDCRLDYPLEVVAFSDEEGRFGGMLGSQSMAGLLSPESIHAAIDLDGVSLVDSMQAVGLNALDGFDSRQPLVVKQKPHDGKRLTLNI